MPPPPEAASPTELAPLALAASATEHESPGRVDAALASAEFRALVPLDIARERLAISQGMRGDGAEIIATAGSAGDAIFAHNLSVRLRRPVRLAERPSPAETIARALDALAARAEEERPTLTASRSADGGLAPSKDGAGGDSGGADRDIAEALAADERDLLRTSGRAPVVRLVNALLFEALAQGASDVHVQPADSAWSPPPEAPKTPRPQPMTRDSHASIGAGCVVVRYRLDGALQEARRLPRRLLEPVVSRVKVMARMDIAEKRLPQDGRAAVRIGPHEIDLRVSTLPTALGERLVIRLLDKRRTEMFDLGRLGLAPGPRALFEGLCARPHGMVLVTGPTGSGKTTTLYSALRRLNSTELNIMTLEDPIEYELPGISQAQVGTRKGLTFATGLRHVLRQDPDVIMVGEIRDGETARIAIQAALTGHLVLSTLHTNSAASAVTRLIDLGVEPFLINAAVSGVLAQRLVRTRCARCGGSGVVGSDRCGQCRGGGLRGRMGLFELLVMTPALRERLARGGSAAEIEAAARAAGMKTLREAGLEAASAGLTTREEVDRATLSDADLSEDGPPPESPESPASPAAEGAL